MNPTVDTDLAVYVAARRRVLRRRRRFGIVAMVTALAMVFGVVPAMAQSGEATGDPATVVFADVSGDPAAVVVRSNTAPTTPTVSINGEAATMLGAVSRGQSDYDSDNVLVIDNSSTSATRYEQIQTAANRYIDGMEPGERVLIVSAGGSPKLEAPFTTDQETLRTAVSTLSVAGTANLYGAITRAARTLGDRPLRVRTITVITASADVGGNAGVARADALSAKSQVDVIALTSDDFAASETGVLRQLANETSGVFASVNDPAELGTKTAEVSRANRSMYTLTFRTDLAAEGGNLTVDLGSGPTVAGFVPNGITAGDSLLKTIPTSGGGVSFLKGSRGLTIALALGALAAGLGAFALGSLAIREDNGLTSVLQPYSEAEGDEVEGNALAKNALFQRAVEMTGNLAEKQGYLSKAEQALEQANLPLRAAEALTFYVGIVFGGGVIGLLLRRSLIGALIFGVFAAMVPPAVLSQLAKRRKKKFMMQLPDTLTLLAGTLKAGYSFMQGVEAVSKEVEAPMGEELRRVVTEAQLGRPLEEALDASALRMGSPDFEWAVMAVRIQREVGGNLAELLLTVAETMTARQRLRGEVAALTAEGKISAIVLGALPLGLGAILWVINPEYMNVLTSDTLGKIMLGVACTSALLGFAWMKKIINIEI